MKKESGQVVILLLLIMVVALAIGLSTIGRSILEVSTSRKSEDSSRAFSAAEAGIESAIKSNENNLGGATTSVNSITLNNTAGATVQAGNLPVGNHALGYSPFDKSAFAQFWLANPVNDSTVSGTIVNSTRSYTGLTFDVYFGDPDITGTKYVGSDAKLKEQPAIEVDVIYWDSSTVPPGYISLKKYYDSYKNASNTAAPRVGDPPNSCVDQYSANVTSTTLSIDNGTGGTKQVIYYCRVTVTGFPNSSTSFPIMVRMRLLYTNLSHPVALRPEVGSLLPQQANIYSSSGTSGDVKRTLEVTNYRSVMPQLFDYVLFSANILNK